VLFDSDPAAVSESECAARGGRVCRYEVRWEEADSITDPPPPSDPTRSGVERWPDYAVDRPTARTHPRGNGVGGNGNREYGPVEVNGTNSTNGEPGRRPTQVSRDHRPRWRFSPSS